MRNGPFWETYCGFITIRSFRSVLQSDFLWAPTNLPDPVPECRPEGLARARRDRHEFMRASRCFAGVDAAVMQSYARTPMGRKCRCDGHGVLRATVDASEMQV